jgi:chaperonin GroEL
MLLRRGIEEAVERVVADLRRHARPLDGHDELRHIATIAAKADERIGEAIAHALDRVGEDGVVTIEESAVPGIEIRFAEGMVVENGFVSPYMARDQHRMETVLENPYILMTTKPITHPQELMPAIGQVMQSPRPLIVLAEKVDGAALGMLVQSTTHGTLEAVAVRAPGFGHRRIAHLQDLAVLTGGEVITDETGLSLDSVERSWFGTARRVVVTADSTTFIDGGGAPDAVEARLGQIRAEIRRATHDRDREIAHERLATLASRLGVIRIGAATDVELKDKLRRAEGALAATRAAMAEGIVPGGGTALLRSEAALDDLHLDGDYGVGAGIVRSVLAEPLYWIASNAGFDGRAVIDQVRAAPDSHGLDALTGQFGDLFAQGVVDPVRVVRLSLEHAASVAALLLTTEAIVAERLLAQPGAVIAPNFGDLAEGLARPSSPV